MKLRNIDKQHQLGYKPFLNIFRRFASLDTSDKKHLANLIPPLSADFQTGDMTLDLGGALSKILIPKGQTKGNKHELY